MKIINRIFGCMLFIAFLGFSVVLLCHALSAFHVRFVSDRVQFPTSLEYPECLNIDNEGRFYCYTRSSQRLQIFDSEGKFLIGWFVRSPNRIEVEKDTGQVTIIDWKGIQYTFDSDGKLLQKTEIEGFEYNKLSQPEDNTYIHSDSKGNEYHYSKTFIVPYVTKVAPEGYTKKITIHEPFYVLFFKWPYPGMFLGILPIIVWSIQSVITKKKKTQNH